MLNSGHTFIIAILWTVNIVCLCYQSHIWLGQLAHWICNLRFSQNSVQCFFILTLCIFSLRPFLIQNSIGKSETASHLTKAPARKSLLINLSIVIIITNTLMQSQLLDRLQLHSPLLYILVATSKIEIGRVAHIISVRDSSEFLIVVDIKAIVFTEIWFRHYGNALGQLNFKAPARPTLLLRLHLSSSFNARDASATLVILEGLFQQ